MKAKNLFVAVFALAICLVSCEKTPSENFPIADQIIGYWVVESIQFFNGEKLEYEADNTIVKNFGFDEEPVIFTPECFLTFSGEVPYSITGNKVIVDIASSEGLSEYEKELSYTISKDGKLVEYMVIKKAQEMELDSKFIWDTSIATYVRGTAPQTTLETIEGDWSAEWVEFFLDGVLTHRGINHELKRDYNFSVSDISVNNGKMSFGYDPQTKYQITIKNGIAYPEMPAEVKKYIKEDFMELSPFRQLKVTQILNDAETMGPNSEAKDLDSFTYNSIVMYFIPVHYGNLEEM